MISFGAAAALSVWFCMVLNLLWLKRYRTAPAKPKGILKRFRQPAWIREWKDTGFGAQYILCTGIALMGAGMLALWIHNPLLLISGFAAGIYLPKFFLNMRRRSKRLSLMEKLVDPLRILISRIPDQGNLVRVLDQVRKEVRDESLREMLDGVLRDIGLGGGIQEALMRWRHQIDLRKFDTFIDLLIQAHLDGWTEPALKALDKAVEAMEWDSRASGTVKEKSRSKKKQLYGALAVSWVFPPVLSMVGIGAGNVYLDTLPGKLLIFAYFIGSIYVMIQGEDYLSLNVDEL
jgi:hypothetical protein